MFTGFALLVFIPVALAQLSNVVVVDFEGAVVQSAEGKKSSEKFNAAVQAKQNELAKKQQEMDDQTKKLQNGARTLSDEAKATLQRDIDRRTTELQRLNEDAQKELSVMRDELLRPIADRASAILNAMAAEMNYTLVIDVSNPETNVIWKNPKNDVTEELIKRINASAPKEPAKPAAAPPATNKPTPTPTKPTTPAPPK
jgi:outer membrane protein